MQNNWQILDMYWSLNEILKECGGAQLSALKLSKMTALELMELLAPNDVRFCVREEQPKIEGISIIPSGIQSLGKDKILRLEHIQKEGNFRLYFDNTATFININKQEMKDLINFVQGQKRTTRDL